MTGTWRPRHHRHRTTVCTRRPHRLTRPVTPLAPRLAVQDLGYHCSRHADEFGAYVLTEPAAFWRGRLSPADVKEVRANFPAQTTVPPEVLLCKECANAEP